MRRERIACAVLALTVIVLLPGGDLSAGDPRARTPWVELGHLERRRCNLELAREAYGRALDRDPYEPEGIAGLGEVLLLEGRVEEALARAEVGLATRRGRRCARLWRVKCLAHLQRREVARARRAATRGAALDPQDPRVQEALARAEFRGGDMDAAYDAYLRATRLDPGAEEANLRLGSGFGPLIDGAPWREGTLAEPFSHAHVAWTRGDLSVAASEFRRLCRLAPDVYKFRLGLGLTLGALRRQAEARFGLGAEARYGRLPAPEPEGLRAVVPGYDDLDETVQHAVRVAVAPAASWIPRLRLVGARHEILPLDASIADASARASLARRRTFDGRTYAHLRGIGGLEAATGVEKLREAAAFGFHTFAHEFAHQIHRHAFPEALREEVTGLYTRAMATDACLDWYAASNEEEYFAQGYEAFVSQAKRGCLKETQSHTRSDLQARDPALHAFLEAHLDLDHETPAAMEAFWSGLR